MLIGSPDRVTGRAQGGLKRFSEVRDIAAATGTPQRSRLFAVKWNPDWEEGLTAGTKMTAATAEVTANTIVLRVDGVIDKTVDWSAGRTIQSVIDEINQRDPTTRARRWKAGVADVNPQTAITAGAGAVSAAADAALGYDDAFYPTSGLTNFIYIAAGSDRALRGGGQFLPGYEDTGYDYPIVNTSVPAGGIGRGGGIDASLGEDILQTRRSAFGIDAPHLQNKEQELNPASLQFQMAIQNVSMDIEFGASEPRRVTVYRWRDSTPIWRADVAGAGPVSVPVPDVVTVGPVFIELSGTSFGAVSATGTYSIYGEERLA